MNEVSTIALVGVIGFILITLSIIWGVIIFNLDKIRLKTNANIETDLQNGKVKADLSADLEGKTAKEKDGTASETLPSSSKQK